MRLLILAAALLGGCATVSNEQKAANAPPARLCEAYFYGPAEVSRVSANEAARRGLNCNDFRQEAALLYQQRMQNQAASDAATNQLSRQLLTPAPAPRVRTCNSYRVGNSVQTDCF
jgi:hypothetical protein